MCRLVNWLMMAGYHRPDLDLPLTLTRLAGAYGMAVAGTMLATTVLLVHVRLAAAGAGPWASTGAPADLVLCHRYPPISPPTLSSWPQGGWIPLDGGDPAVGGDGLLWRVGTEATPTGARPPAVTQQMSWRLLRHDHIPRVPGRGRVPHKSDRKAVPALLTQHVQHMGALQETVIALSIRFVERPRVAAHDRATRQTYRRRVCGG